MNLSILRSRSAYPASWPRAYSPWRHGAAVFRQSVASWLLSAPSRFLGSRCTCRLQVLWRLSWRAIFAVTAIVYAVAFGAAETAYMRAMAASDPVTVLWEFDRAYRLFPFSQDFRVAHAQASIRFQSILPRDYVISAIHRSLDQDPGAPDMIVNLHVIESEAK